MGPTCRPCLDLPHRTLPGRPAEPGDPSGLTTYFRPPALTLPTVVGGTATGDTRTPRTTKTQWDPGPTSAGTPPRVPSESGRNL